MRGLLNMESSKRTDYFTIINLLDSIEKKAESMNHSEIHIPNMQIFQVPTEVNIPPATLELKKPNSKKKDLDLDKLELLFDEDYNAAACKKILDQREIDFVINEMIDPDMLSSCYFNALVLTNFKLYSLSDELLKQCQLVVSTRQDPVSLQSYIRICFMRINNLKILNKKTEALQIATGLSYFMKEKNSGVPTVIADLLVSISNLQFLTNDIGRSLEELNFAAELINRLEMDELCDSKLAMVNLMTAKIQLCLGNYQKTKNMIVAAVEKDTFGRSDFLLLKAESCMELRHYRESESILLRLEKSLNEQRKADAEVFIKINLLYFVIAILKNDSRSMQRARQACMNFIKLLGVSKPLYQTMLISMEGYCKLDLDSEAASDKLRQAAEHLDKISPEHLGLRLMVFRIFLDLLYECQYVPMHLRYIDTVLRGIESQCSPDHFSLIRIIKVKCKVFMKNDQYEEAKRMALYMREICNLVEEKIENWELLFDIWSTYPIILYQQGFFLAAYNEFSNAQTHLEQLRKEKYKGRSPTLGQVDPPTIYACLCRIWMYRIEADIDPDQSSLADIFAIISDLKIHQGEEIDQVFLHACKVYFRIIFNLNRKKSIKISQRDQSSVTVVNYLIKLVNACKSARIKLEGIFVVVEYLAYYDIRKDCENYIEKAYYLIANDPELLPRKSELGLHYKSKAFRILCQYNLLHGEDDLDISSRASKLLKGLRNEIEAKRSRTANSLLYIKARYRICLAMADLSEHSKSEREYSSLLHDILRLRFRVGYWQYHCRLIVLKSNIESSPRIGSPAQIADELLAEAQEIFGKGSIQAKIANDYKLSLDKKS